MLTLNDGRKELYQWDSGRKATVTIDCGVVHFSNLNYGEALPVEVKGGEVEIPNKLLMIGAPVYCWAFITDDDGAYTKAEQVLTVVKRPKPSDYVYKDSEVFSVESVVNTALEKAKEHGDFDGKSAYEYAVEGGYKGTEKEFTDALGGIGNTSSGGDITTEAAYNTFSNALKGNKSGAALSITDVSPLEHTLGVKVSAKNLFDKNAWTRSFGDVEIDGIPCLNIYENKSTYIVPGNSSDVYVMSVRMYRTDGSTNKTNLQATQEDGRTRTVVANLEMGTLRTGVVYGGDVLIFDGWGLTNLCIDLTAAQLERGTSATEYVPHVTDIGVAKVIANGREYSVNADGTVNGVVKSEYPITTITTDTDGVVVDCQYNKDINAVIDELRKVIISLGGNI